LRNGTASVFDFASGKVFGAHAPRELFDVPATATYPLLATRAHAGGFWLAGGAANSEPLEER
jgi:hypothetical protein